MPASFRTTLNYREAIKLKKTKKTKNNTTTLQLPGRKTEFVPRISARKVEGKKWKQLPVISKPYLFIYFFFCLFAVSLGRSRGIWRFPG